MSICFGSEDVLFRCPYTWNVNVCQGLVVADDDGDRIVYRKTAYGNDELVQP